MGGGALKVMYIPHHIVKDHVFSILLGVNCGLNIVFCSDSVTHIVTGYETVDRVLAFLER